MKSTILNKNEIVKFYTQPNYGLQLHVCLLGNI